MFGMMKKHLLWLKMSYEKKGKWEYRLKKHAILLIGNKSCPLFSI